MAKIKIDDLAGTEELDAEEQRAVQGGGLKKWKKKARKAASDKAPSVGIAALQTTADVGQANQNALNKAGETADTAGDIAVAVHTEMYNH